MPSEKLLFIIFGQLLRALVKSSFFHNMEVIMIERNANLKIEAFLSCFLYEEKGFKIVLIWINSYCSVQLRKTFTFGTKMEKIHKH